MIEPHISEPDFTLYLGDVRDVMAELPDRHVDCIVTSPPYWGLRDYGTGEWEGGDPDCDHIAPARSHAGEGLAAWSAENARGGGHVAQIAKVAQYRDVCGKCGAARTDRQLGLEATPDCLGWATGDRCCACYVCELVAILAECRRVLADHGTLWLNLGDSYGGGSTSRNLGRGDADRDFTGGGGNRAGTGNPGTQGSVRMSAGVKRKELVGVPWRVALALQADGWYLRSDVIWCLSGGTRLYARTAKGDGPAMLKDLARLNPDTVQLWNGERWTRVLGWHRAPERGQPLQVVLASGERIGCTAGHVWPTQRGNVRGDALEVGDVIATTRLPEPTTPDHPRFLPDEEVGYLVGRYLADGSTSGECVQIACHRYEAEAVAARVAPVALALHGSTRIHRTGGNHATVNLHGPLIAPLIRGYVHGNTARNKGLRARVWRRTDVFLHALLTGYLEGDGHYDAANDRWRLGFTRNARLAGDLRTLAARLDLPLRLVASTATGFGRQWPAYRGQIRLTPSQHRNAAEYGKVVAIERARGQHFWDVEVADDPHLFALASGVLTHNSKPNAMPASVTDRPTSAHEYFFLLAKKPIYYYDQDAVREPHKPDGRRVTTRTVAGGSHDNYQTFDHSEGRERWPGIGRNLRTVWEIATRPYADAHFATYPDALVQRAIAAGCPREVCTTCGKPRERMAGARVLDLNRPQARRALELAEAAGLTDAHIDAIRSVGIADTGKALITTTGAGRNLPEIIELADQAKAALGGYYREFLLARPSHGGWSDCECAYGLEPGDLDVISTPTGNGNDDDPTLEVGRAGMSRPRGDDEGVRPITRYEQRCYADQLRNHPRQPELVVDAGGPTTFAHYLRTDRSGARPVPGPLLERWIADGTLERVTLPTPQPGTYRPGIVLDPFLGSGTTAVVARRERRHAIGVELNPDYVPLIRKRVDNWHRRPAATPTPPADQLTLTE